MIPNLGGDDATCQYNNAIPLLMNEYLPNGMLGIALTGLMASFMAGVAANVSRVQHGGDDRPRRAVHRARAATTRATSASAASRRSAASWSAIGTALIASGYDNLMNYLQALFSIFNAPLFATFIIGMFWKRMTPAAGLWGLVAGTIAALVTFVALQGASVISLRLRPRRVVLGRGRGVRRRRGRHGRRDAA